mgnify:CR=1 FL=1
MIPADIASRLRFVQNDIPAPTQPATPAQKLADVLSDLVPGQRILAEIQSQLPNGSYRAVVSQRDVTLALPFSAKSGDTLELEVVENNGTFALAFVANRTTDEKAAKSADSVATSFSQTGRLIGNLIKDIAEPGQRASPAPLNGNQPLLDRPPASAAELAPILKEALAKSGVFYEAHQARWVAGHFSTEGLLEEPQGKLSSHSLANPTTTTEQNTKASTGRPDTTTPQGQDSTKAQRAEPSAPSVIPRELTPIVQQQLDGLASQNYAWQGQIWPEQNLYWEIAEEDSTQGRSSTDNESRWSTRLKLDLPGLGGVEAALVLTSTNKIELALNANTPGGEEQLRSHLPTLLERLSAADLVVTKAKVLHGDIAE